MNPHFTYILLNKIMNNPPPFLIPIIKTPCNKIFSIDATLTFTPDTKNSLLTRSIARMTLERPDWTATVLIVVVDGGNSERSVISDILVWSMNDKSTCVAKSSKSGLL